MINNLVIRNLQKDDYYKNYLQLLNQLTSIDPNKISINEFTEFINKLNDDHQIIVIENDNNIIGSVTILVENKIIHNMGKVAHIEDVVVDNNIRGHGIGKMLMNKIIDIGKLRGCYKMILNCNETNITFYKKCGFKQKEVEMVLYFDKSI